MHTIVTRAASIAGLLIATAATALVLSSGPAHADPDVAGETTVSTEVTPTPSPSPTTTDVGEWG